MSTVPVSTSSSLLPPIRRAWGDRAFRWLALASALTIAASLAKGSGVASLTAAFDPLAPSGSPSASPLGIADAVALSRALDHHDIPGAALIADGRAWNDRGASEAEELAAVGGDGAHDAFGAAAIDQPEAGSRNRAPEQVSGLGVDFIAARRRAAIDTDGSNRVHADDW